MAPLTPTGVKEKIKSELSFQLFKHKELFCCVARMGFSGCLNGYVAVSEKYPLCRRGITKGEL